jgi:hypothetical protein
MSDYPQFLEKRIENPIDYYMYQYLKKLKMSIRDSELFQNVEEIINRSQDKNLLQLSLFGKSFDVSYTNRKYIVYGLSLFSTALHSMNNKYRLRTILPYYVFWSSLLCHENLNPYI